MSLAAIVTLLLLPLEIGVPTKGGNVIPLWLFIPGFLILLAWTLWRRKRAKNE